LYQVLGGGLLIDNPGLRDIAVWASDAPEIAFEEIETLATKCRFRKCTHHQEPGCAVQRAVRQKRLSGALLARYHQAQRTR